MLPDFLLRTYRKIRTGKHPRGYKFKGKTASATFTSIYLRNHWKSAESKSGPGSTAATTQFVRKKLKEVIDSYQIRTILDIPCGDFNWMKLMDLHGIEYTGADIVGDLVDSNKKQFSSASVNFERINLLEDSLPQKDLIICRDCLVHFSFADIGKALENIKRSKSRLLLTTTFSDRIINEDIITGGWRPLNLAIEPFNMTRYEFVFNENQGEPLNPGFPDKSLMLYQITDLT